MAAAAPPAAPVVRFTAAAPARPLSVQEPPPWLDEQLPDDEPVGAAPAMFASDRAEPADDLPLARPALAAAGPPPLRTEPLPSTPLPTTPLGDQWAAVIRPLVAAGSVAALARELALQAELLAVAPDSAGGRRWRLAVERETLRNPALAAKLASALQESLGEPVQIEVTAGMPRDSIARRDSAAREAAQQAAEQLIQNDPVVLALMAQFRTARLVPGSIKPLAADGGETKAPTP